MKTRRWPGRAARNAVVSTLMLLVVPSPAATQVPDLPQAPVSEADRAELVAFLESYYDAFSDRDWERFQDHFWTDATLTTVWPPAEGAPERVLVTTITEFIEQAPLGPGSREIFEERMLALEISVRGDLATAYARYAARFGDPGEIMEWEGIDSFQLMRHEGRWRIVSLAFLSDG